MTAPSFVRRVSTNWELGSRTFHTGYVGFSPSLNTVIVAHQGTDPSKL